MGIDVADPETRQGVPLDEMQHFLIHGYVRPGQVLERR